MAGADDKSGASTPHEEVEGCLDCPHPDYCAGMGKCEIGAAKIGASAPDWRSLRGPDDKPCTCSGDCDRYILALEAERDALRVHLGSGDTTAKGEAAPSTRTGAAPSVSAESPQKHGPCVRYCRACGRQMVLVSGLDGFDERTGAPWVEVILECPRFGRSWRNLWLGGWRHYGAHISGSQFGEIDLEIAWR